MKTDREICEAAKEAHQYVGNRHCNLPTHLQPLEDFRERFNPAKVASMLDEIEEMKKELARLKGE